MKGSIVLLCLVGLAGCEKQPVSPVGTYFLEKDSIMYVLNVDKGGSYLLHVTGSGHSNDIRGPWLAEDGSGRSISFSGIIWEGVLPHSGNGFWKADIVGEKGKICLDGEELICFVKRPAEKK